MLSTSELNTLSIIADTACRDRLSRAHLEKLSRLDLIEPGLAGPALSPKGREILVKRR